MRVALVVNAHLSRNDRQGPGKIGYCLARGLLDKGALGKVICYSADQSVDIPDRYLVSLEQSLLLRKAFRVGYRIGSALPQLPVRLYEERRFDRIASRIITAAWGDTLFCTKPVNPDTIIRSKQLGLLTVMSTSVLHPRFNQLMVEQEQKHLGTKDTSVYTDERRVAHLTRAISSVDRIIAANGFFRDNYRAFGVDPEKFLIPDPERPHEGVDTACYSPPPAGVLREGRFQVLHVSHMTLIKGVQYLLAAWQQVESQIDGELVLVGSLDANMRDVMRQSGARKVRLTGAKNPVEEYRRASLFVSPSVSDAGPNTVFEAMACGTPAIVSTSCSVSRFIQDGVNGYIYRYDDIAKLAATFVHLYRHASVRETIAGEALKTAQRFSIRDYTDTWLSLLAQISSRVL